MAPSESRTVDVHTPPVLAPLDGVLSRLPTSARLILLVVLLLVPAALANFAFTRTITGQLDFSLTERDGVVVLEPALVAMADTVAGRSPDLAAVEQAVQSLPALGLDSQWQAVQTAGQKVRTGGEDAAARAELAAALAELVTETGNSSNLILDPDLDSFYVMDTLVVQIPRLLVTGAQSQAPDLTVDRTDQVASQAVRAGTISSAAEAVASDVATATANTADESLSGRLTELGPLAEAGKALAGELTSALDSPGPVDPKAVGIAAGAAIPGTAEALDVLLGARTGALARQRTTTLALALVALVASCWFAAGVWWRTRRDVTLVLGAVTAIAQDDLVARELPNGREEFGSIGRALEVARNQLEDAQSALAMSQSAREEQMQAGFKQQRKAEHDARARAQEAVDTTAATVVAELGEVVTQVDAVRGAASTIDSRVSAADGATRSVVDQAKEADKLVSALADSLGQVGGMASLIAGIADQTRLLALNATIESARAGEAGRGFSVVAQEVKNLAVTTAKSTDRITSTIGGLQRDAQAVASAITNMGQSIMAVDEVTEVLGNVATEQHALVERLDRRVSEVIDRVNGMSSLGEKLERRAHERIPAASGVRLELGGGRPVEARMADISAGGIRCRVPAAGAPRRGDSLTAEIQLADGTAKVHSTVAWARVTGDECHLGLEFSDPSGAEARRIAAHVATLDPSFG